MAQPLNIYIYTYIYTLVILYIYTIFYRINCLAINCHRARAAQGPRKEVEQLPRKGRARLCARNVRNCLIARKAPRKGRARPMQILSRKDHKLPRKGSAQGNLRNRLSPRKAPAQGPRKDQ